ncbi:MAG: hypothetical protein JXO48_08895, partial [Deltaproteobacteria bacterium]|nr:hypothetical protein [Deltaproteobacteria bacterium]
VCPDQQYLQDEYGNLVLDDQGNPIPVYGNVIFVPEYSEQAYDIEILMESGKKGPKSAPAATELEVTDWCSGFAPNDPAKLRLPKNDGGYAVYARVLAKPTDDPDIEIYDPGLALVEDENGNDLLYLGLVTETGFQTEYVSFTRTKGKPTAVDITGLFLWTGSIYYLVEPAEGEYVSTLFCARDNDADGIYDEYYIKDPELACDEGYTEVTLYMISYENEWVFSIADFVEYFWNIDNNGVKLIQVRFYPL